MVVHFFDFAVEGIPLPRSDTDRAFSKITVEVPEGEDDFEDRTHTGKYSPEANNLGALVAAKQSVAKILTSMGGMVIQQVQNSLVPQVWATFEGVPSDMRADQDAIGRAITAATTLAAAQYHRRLGAARQEKVYVGGVHIQDPPLKLGCGIACGRMMVVEDQLCFGDAVEHAMLLSVLCNPKDDPCEVLVGAAVARKFGHNKPVGLGDFLKNLDNVFFGIGKYTRKHNIYTWDCKQLTKIQMVPMTNRPVPSLCELWWVRQMSKFKKLTNDIEPEDSEDGKGNIKQQKEGKDEESEEEASNDGTILVSVPCLKMKSTEIHKIHVPGMVTNKYETKKKTDKTVTPVKQPPKAEGQKDQNQDQDKKDEKDKETPASVPDVPPPAKRSAEAQKEEFTEPESEPEPVIYNPPERSRVLLAMAWGGDATLLPTSLMGEVMQKDVITEEEIPEEYMAKEDSDSDDAVDYREVKEGKDGSDSASNIVVDISKKLPKQMPEDHVIKAESKKREKLAPYMHLALAASGLSVTELMSNPPIKPPDSLFLFGKVDDTRKERSLWTNTSDSKEIEVDTVPPLGSVVRYFSADETMTRESYELSLGRVVGIHGTGTEAVCTVRTALHGDVRRRVRPRDIRLLNLDSVSAVELAEAAALRKAIQHQGNRPGQRVTQRLLQRMYEAVCPENKYEDTINAHEWGLLCKEVAPDCDGFPTPSQLSSVISHLHSSPCDVVFRRQSTKPDATPLTKVARKLQIIAQDFQAHYARGRLPRILGPDKPKSKRKPRVKKVPVKKIKKVELELDPRWQATKSDEEKQSIDRARAIMDMFRLLDLDNDEYLDHDEISRWRMATDHRTMQRDEYAQLCRAVDADVNIGLDFIAFTNIYARIYKNHDPVKDYERVCARHNPAGDYSVANEFTRLGSGNGELMGMATLLKDFSKMETMGK